MPWAPDYCTVEELADWLNDANDANDDVYAAAIGAASRLIDDWTGRQFGSSLAESRTYAANGLGRVEIDDLAVAPVTVVDGAGAAVTGYTLGPVNAPQTGKVWTRIGLAEGYDLGLTKVIVTAAWGWTEVPPAVKLACLMQAARFAKRKDSPYGISGSPDAQGELRLLARLDPDVQTSLTAYRRKVLPR